MKIITANRLADGAVVFLGTDGWHTDINAAARLSAPDAVEAGLAIAARAAEEQLVVETAAIDVDMDEYGALTPMRLRERIRAFGPTVAYGRAASAKQRETAREAA